MDFNIGAPSDRVKAQPCFENPSRGGTLGNNFLASLKMQILKSGALYFALVFGAGFVLGTIRVLLVVPRIGTRTAELIETPVMVLVSFMAARWTIRRLVAQPTTTERIAIGFVALALLVSAEFTFVRWLQGLTISEYLASRDPVAGTAYVIALGLFAVMPLFVDQ